MSEADDMLDEIAEDAPPALRAWIEARRATLRAKIEAAAAVPSSNDAWRHTPVPMEGGGVLSDYDKLLVQFSGGKDSIAMVLHLLDLGVPRERIELWHQDVDGGVRHFMDWPCTRGYCVVFAAAFGLRLLFQWKDGGYEGELLRENARTRPTTIQMLDGSVTHAGRSDEQARAQEYATRRQFPAQAADLKTRWCSAYLKIDVAAKVFTNDPRFKRGRYLVVTGERAQESTNRARYDEAEWYRRKAKKGGPALPPPRPSDPRVILQWRPVHKWSEDDVWAIIARWGVLPHPAYRLGFGRLSCQSCIFGLDDQWATIGAMNPHALNRIADYEVEFAKTIEPPKVIPFDDGGDYVRHADGSFVTRVKKVDGVDTLVKLRTTYPGRTVRDRAAVGRPYFDPRDPAMAALARASQHEGYNEPILIDPAHWRRPLGAGRVTGGPI